MKKAVILLLSVSSVIGTSAVSGHHSFAEFDSDRTVTITGVVKEFRLVNPHAMMTFEVTGESGEKEEWKVEFDGRLNLGRSGWTPDTIKAGEKITVVGNPAVSGSPYMFFNSAVKGDGSELIRPAQESFDAIDEERRLRRQQRASLE